MNTELLSLLEKDARLTPQQLATMLGSDEKDVAAQIAEYEKKYQVLADRYAPLKTLSTVWESYLGKRGDNR